MAVSVRGWLARDLSIYMICAVILGIVHSASFTLSQWLLYPSLLIAFLLTYGLIYIAHEWGHWLGTVATAGEMTLAPYKGILIGYFNPASHTRAQFLAMSWGGVAGYVTASSVAVLGYTLSPSPLTAAVATAGLAFTVQSLAVDLPQILKVHAHADPLETNRAGTEPRLIVKRTVQTWIPLGLLLALWSLMT